MRRLFLFFVFLYSSAFACDCPPLKAVSKQSASEYNVVFYGHVDSVSACEHGISSAWFSISKLFRGAVPQQVRVNFDCASSCMMSFSVREEWIIYASYERFDRLNVKFCSHSRKRAAAGEIDAASSMGRIAFESELQLLESELGLQQYKETEEIKGQLELRPHNTQPAASSKLWLLLISLGAMLLVYLVIKFRKK